LYYKALTSNPPLMWGNIC